MIYARSFAVVVISLSLLLSTLPSIVQATNLTLPSGGVVSVEFVFSAADFVHDVSVVSPLNRFLFNTERTRLGTTVFLGNWPAGTVFEFEMVARTDGTTYTWSSDPAKNSDGEDHVRTTQIDPVTFKMEWEDLPGLGDRDFNDATMIVRIGGDSDGDGLWDIWETNGVDHNWDGIIDLPIHQAPYNADPNHKDIFVEIDWMQDATHSHQPKAGVVALVVAAFAAAPVTNPDGIDGITLHVDVSNAIAHQDYLRFDPPAGVGDFDTVKAANFDPARRSVYHYCLFIHHLGFALGYSGYAEVPGNDFMVSFGEWYSGRGDIDGDGLDDEDVGTVMDQAGTLMHELGHNLNLRHGGGDDTGYKPNYLSVMNYFFQRIGIPPTDRLDYSHDDLPDLNENSLDEFLGIQDGADDTFFFDPTGTQRLGSGTGSIDWDWDGTIEGTSGGTANVAVNINGRGGFQTLTGWDDWDNVKYIFTDTDDFEDGVHETPEAVVELDFETVLRMLPLTTLQRLRSYVMNLYKNGEISQHKYDRITGYLVRTENDINNAMDYLDTVRHGFDDIVEGLFALKSAVKRLECLIRDLRNWVKWGDMPNDLADEIIQRLESINLELTHKAKSEAESERMLAVAAIEDAEARGINAPWLWNQLTYVDQYLANAENWLAEEWLSKAVSYYKMAFYYSQRTTTRAWHWSWDIDIKDWVDLLEEIDFINANG